MLALVVTRAEEGPFVECACGNALHTKEARCVEIMSKLTDYNVIVGLETMTPLAILTGLT